MHRLSVLALLTAVLAAADAPPSLVMAAGAAQVDIGKPLPVTLTLDYPAAWKQDREPDPLTAFSQVQNLGAVVRRQADGRQFRQWSFQVLATRSGAWALPRPRLTLQSPTGPQEVTANEVIVQVGTGAAEPDLAPPRPPWTRPAPASAHPLVRRWPWIAAGGVLLAAILAFALRRRHRRPPPTPYEQFLADLPQAGVQSDGKVLAAALSQALRRYCGAIWAFDGLGATPRETLDHLGREGGPGTERISALRRVFSNLEELRWAPSELAGLTLAPLIDQARAWVEAIEAERAAALAAAAAAGKGKTP